MAGPGWAATGGGLRRRGGGVGKAGQALERVLRHGGHVRVVGGDGGRGQRLSIGPLACDEAPQKTNPSRRQNVKTTCWKNSPILGGRVAQPGGNIEMLILVQKTSQKIIYTLIYIFEIYNL